MAFLNFMKKGDKLPDDIDLDMPPEPPKMMKGEIATEEPINEELMPIKKGKKLGKKAKARKEEIPELPPLPKEEGLDELPELPPLPEEKEGELPLLEEEGGELGEELPPPPVIKKGKEGFFSFLKPKKAAKELELPKIEEEIPEMPPLPGGKEEIHELPPLPDIGGKEEIKEFPEIPPMPEEKEPLFEEKEIPTIPPIEPVKAPVMEKELEKPMPEIKEAEPVERPTKKFITIDDFKQIQGDISGMKGSLRGIDDVFAKLEDFKGKGDREYAGLYNGLKDIQTKIMFVDKSLFKEEV